MRVEEALQLGDIAFGLGTVSLVRIGVVYLPGDEILEVPVERLKDRLAEKIGLRSKVAKELRLGRLRPACDGRGCCTCETRAPELLFRSISEPVPELLGRSAREPRRSIHAATKTSNAD